MEHIKTVRLFESSGSAPDGALSRRVVRSFLGKRSVQRFALCPMRHVLRALPVGPRPNGPKRLNRLKGLRGGVRSFESSVFR